MDNRLAIFVCDLFLPEAREVLQSEHYHSVEIYAVPRICDGAQLPTGGVFDNILAQSANFSKAVLIGCPCLDRAHAALVGKLRNLEFIRQENCFEILLGKTTLQHFLHQGAYLMTPGRARNFAGHMQAAGFSHEAARSFFGETTMKILILDTGIETDVADSAAAVSDFLGLPCEVLPVGLDHIRLFLSKCVQQFRLESERDFTNQRLAQITKQANDYSMVFDRIESLVRLRRESEIVSQVFELMYLLFAPANIAFISEPAGKPAAVVYFNADDAFDVAKTDDESFSVEISNQDIRYGRFVIRKVAFPQYLNHYKNLSFCFANVIGLAFANSSLYKQVLENERVLQSNAERLEELNATKDKLFTVIAHDLINPFNALIGLSNLLLHNFDKMASERKLEWIRMINASAGEALQLLQNLLNWARNQTGQIKFEPAMLDAPVVMDEIMRLVASQAVTKSVRVDLQIDPGAKLFGDRDMVQTVIRNLLTNAIKFSQPGDAVVLRCVMHDDHTSVSVQDSGVGIAAENLPMIFGEQGKLVERGTGNELGSGLGLILCKEFVERHGGTISVISEPSKGSEFTFCLPLPPK